MARATGRPLESDRIRILYLAANPANTDRLELGREVRGILEKIRAARHRDSVELVSYWATRPDDLLQALLDVEPHILHFSGHGAAHSGILLEGEATGERLVDAGAVVDLVGTLKENIRLIVLNACHTEPLARALVSHVDCAVGMQRAISDDASVEFATAFYQAIGFGRSVGVAFNLGLSALRLRNIADVGTPRLVSRDGLDPAELFLLRTQRTKSQPARGAAGSKTRARRPRAGGAPSTAERSVLRALRLREFLPGEWRTEAMSGRGLVQGRGSLRVESLGTFKGYVSGSVEGIFVDGRWGVTDGDRLELRGLLLAQGRLSIHTSTIQFSSMCHEALYGESSGGERIAWRRVEVPASN